jgi:predicted site-specific integrase-resolvase
MLEHLDGHISVIEAAEMLRVSYHTARNWLLTGRYGLAGVHVGRYRFVTRLSVQRARRHLARRRQP